MNDRLVWGDFLVVVKGWTALTLNQTERRRPAGFARADTQSRRDGGAPVHGEGELLLPE